MTQPRSIRHYGWIPDEPDQRDHLYVVPGIKGYFTMPFTYFIQPGLAQDFWTIRLVGK